MKPEQFIERYRNGEMLGNPTPPSDTILAVYREHKTIPSVDIVEETTRKVLLPVHEVKF